jgi:hypothetical protein
MAIGEDTVFPSVEDYYLEKEGLSGRYHFVDLSNFLYVSSP